MIPNNRDCFQFSMVEAVNSVLVSAKKHQQRVGGKTRIPSILNDEDVRNLQVLCQLLEPLADFTDELQADGITSSLAIIGGIRAIKGSYFFINKLVMTETYNYVNGLSIIFSSDVEQVDIDNDLESFDDLFSFKSLLLNCICYRFSSKEDIRLVIEGPKKRGRKVGSVVRIDLFQHHWYVLASFLDPRLRLIPFEGNQCH